VLNLIAGEIQCGTKLIHPDVSCGKNGVRRYHKFICRPEPILIARTHRIIKPAIYFLYKFRVCPQQVSQTSKANSPDRERSQGRASHMGMRAMRDDYRAFLDAARGPLGGTPPSAAAVGRTRQDPAGGNTRDAGWRRGTSAGRGPRGDRRPGRAGGLPVSSLAARPAADLHRADGRGRVHRPGDCRGARLPAGHGAGQGARERPEPLLWQWPDIGAGSGAGPDGELAVLAARLPSA
jgi:hypothetical protein